MARRAIHPGGRALATLAVALAATLVRGQAASSPPLDAFQRAVIESLAAPPRTEPAELLEAAILAADVDVPAVAVDYLGRLAMTLDQAGPKVGDILADLGDATPDATLARLADRLGPREPKVRRLLTAIRDAGRQRRRDPAVLARAVADLDAASYATRLAATERLARAGVDALPALVPVLAGAGRQAELARGIVARLGAEARQPLLDWLGNGDPAGWAGVIEALEATGLEGIEPFLLAPALVPGTPREARDAAVAALAARGSDVAAAGGREAAIAALAARLDGLLSPAGLPAVDHLLLEPVRDPTTAAAAFGGDVRGTVDRWFWNPGDGDFTRVAVPPRVARAREAAHLARDLAALDARDEAVVALVLLARLEGALATAGDPLTVLERVPATAIREPLSGPDGFSIATAGRVFEQAVERGMWESAAAIATAIAPGGDSAPGRAGSPGTLPIDVREALVRALDVPDAALQFAAARSLALAAGAPPYRGSSRVVEALLYAATGTGADRVVVAHPDAEVAHALAAGVSRHGYEPVRVSTGRGAIIAARSSADTVLVLLSSRVATPTALETVEFLQQQGQGDVPAVLVMIDPLDDDGRGGYLTKRILAFCDLHRIALVDRLDSLFLPAVDPETNEETAPARFPDVLAQAAGPAAVDPATRAAAAGARLARAREALGLLGRLGRRGQDVSPALETARLALLQPELYAPAASLLATLGRAEAQSALEAEAARPDLPEAARVVAQAAFEASVERWGILLDSREMLAAYRRYNRAADDTTRGAAGGVLDVLEAAGRTSTPPDAASLAPRR